MQKKLLSMMFVCTITVLPVIVFAENEIVTDSEEIVTKVIGGFTDKDNTYIDLLVNHRPSEKNRRAIILHFCDVVLGVYKDASLGQASFSYSNMSYDPKKSLFVYSLCVNMDKAPGHTNYKEQFKATQDFDIEKFIKDDVTDFNDIRNIPAQDSLDSDSAYHGCNPKTTMGNCNFTNFLPDIYTTIMNDLSNIKLASIYGYKYDHSKQEDRDKAIREFSESYFAEPEKKEGTCNAKDMHYLYQKQQQDGSTLHCGHPKTYQYLEEMIKSAGKLIKKTDLLDGKAIMEIGCSDSIKNPMACAMATSGFYFVEGSWKSFENVLLNEQMFYNLFLGYYQGLIDEFINYQPLSFKNIGVTTERDSYESLVIAQEQQMAQTASYQMMRQLKNLYATFPIHIGLLAYYEDLLYLRNRFVSLYTPLHQLYYEFRNTQECSN